MLKRTPLYDWHKKSGARMVEFGGWEMPVQYKNGVIAEHNAVRERAGLFDICHMGEIFITGKRASDFADYITTNEVGKLANSSCQYTACCYENGGIVDDVIVCKFDPEKYLVVVNASNTDKDFEWFGKNAKYGVSIRNESNEFSQLALQGPVSEKILKPLVDYPLDGLDYYHFCETSLRGKKIILSRTGYTGEDGFEIYGASNDALFLWETILAEGREYGVAPIGLAARDTLRLEAAYSLYGHEISEEVNPFEARLGWIVKLDKKEFIGQKMLQKIFKEGVKRRVVGLETLAPGIPRQGFEVWNEEEKIGHITSGTFSPTLEKPVAMALVDKKYSGIGDKVFVQIRDRKLGAKVVLLPFYKRKA